MLIVAITTCNENSWLSLDTFLSYANANAMKMLPYPPARLASFILEHFYSFKDAETLLTLALRREAFF